MTRNPEGQLRQAEGEAASLARQLADVADTAALPQLARLLDRYGEALDALEEEDTAWLTRVRKQTNVSLV